MDANIAGFAHRHLPRLLLQTRDAVMFHTRPVLCAHAPSDQRWRAARVQGTENLAKPCARLDPLIDMEQT